MAIVDASSDIAASTGAQIEIAASPAAAYYKNLTEILIELLFEKLWNGSNNARSHIMMCSNLFRSKSLCTHKQGDQMKLMKKFKNMAQFRRSEPGWYIFELLSADWRLQHTQSKVKR